MARRFLLVGLAPLLLAGPASAGPITVFTEIAGAGGNNTGEIPVAGLGNWAVLTWGSGPGPAVTVPGNQTSARQAVVGFWPVLGFANPAQFEAQRGTVVTVPETPVTLRAEVWNGDYGRAGVDHRDIFIDATVSARVGTEAGQNAVDWRFIAVPPPVVFADQTIVSFGYQAVRTPDGVPQIQFQDGSATIGFPGPTYYPSLLDVVVDVTRPPAQPGSPGGGETGGPTDPPGVAATPEPSGAILMMGFALSGLAVGRTGRGSGRRTGQ